MFCNHPTTPNILWINCDDLGCELACYGNQDIYTTSMDKLAAQGVMYKNAYANVSVCSASRNGLLTGTYEQRFGLQWNLVTWNMKHRGGERVVPVEQSPGFEITQYNGFFLEINFVYDYVHCVD